MVIISSKKCNIIQLKYDGHFSRKIVTIGILYFACIKKTYL